MKQNQTQKITQKLVISQDMKQSLKILQMSTNELKQHIEEEKSKNPFLTLDDEIESISTNATQDKKSDLPNSSINIPNSLSQNKNSYQEEFLSKLIPKNITLKEYLIEQIEITIHDAKEKFIALYLTDLLDDNGYLSEEKKTIAITLNCNIEKLESVLFKLYKLDPPGVYAENLADCLMIQLKERDLLDNNYKLILENLKLLALGDINKLKKLCNITEDKIKTIIKKIKSLEPKPGRLFSNDPVQLVIPEIIIEKSSDHNLEILLNGQALPTVIFNKDYYNNVSKSNLINGEKDFCKIQKNKALLLMNSIAQRSKVLLKIVNKLLDYQYEFFMYGVNFLKPLTLSQVAKDLKIHESTISRAGNKYISTPYGTFELKFFFTSKISSSISENEYSSTAIKNKIKTLIDQEHRSSISSDQKISDILMQKEGIKISRRTVTKYREALKIPSSQMRKKIKKL